MTSPAHAVLLAPPRQLEPVAVMAGSEAQAYEDLMAWLTKAPRSFIGFELKSPLRARHTCRGSPFGFLTFVSHAPSQPLLDFALSPSAAPEQPIESKALWKQPGRVFMASRLKMDKAIGIPGLPERCWKHRRFAKAFCVDQGTVKRYAESLSQMQETGNVYV